MTELLFRLFIKNRKNISDTNVRESYGVLGGIVGICLNITLAIMKICVGALSLSVSVIADALNNFSDALSSIITLIGFKMSGKPADKQHPFGHGRIEYVSALFVAIAIFFMGFELVQSSLDKIINSHPIVYTPSSLIILVISILVKLWMFFFNKKLANTIKSQSMVAASKDSLIDCIATTAVLLGIVLFKITSHSFDGYIGLIVACFILFAGYQTIRDSLSPLLGQPPSEELVEEIKNMVLSHEGIIGLHDLIIHNYGPTRFMLSLHAEIRANDDVLKLHDTIDLIEKQLQKRFLCDAVIHMDPIETDNELINNTKKLVSNIVSSIDERLSMHDFRMVTGPTHTNLIFDIVVPFGFDISDEQIIRRIQDEVFDLDKTYFSVINIDKNYI